MSDKDPHSESGSILRHEARTTPFTAPEHHGVHCEAIEAHLAKYVGKVASVWHEIISDLVHLDLLFVPADEGRDHHYIVTSGVSDLPMTVPEGYEDWRRVELMIALPASWPLSQQAFANEANYWPLRWLKQVGRLPHEYQTWIGYGHTIPNGDPPKPIADTQFTGVMLTPPYHLPPEFFTLPASGEKIRFYMLTPLYQEELDLKLEKGAEELEERFDKRRIGFVLDTKRANVAARRGWFW
jgi:hypothetical protein